MADKEVKKAKKEIKEVTCPKCDMKGNFCTYVADDGGGSCTMDVYRLQCPHCGYDKEESEYGGGAGNEHETNCPFCSVTVFSHIIGERK